MAAKRKMGLSGSPSHHKSRFRTYAGDALESYAEVLEKARAGNCALALDWYDEGQRTDGKATAHALEAVEGGEPESLLESSLVRRLESAEASAKKIMLKKCIVNSGLSGLRRKTRRK